MSGVCAYGVWIGLLSGLAAVWTDASTAVASPVEPKQPIGNRQTTLGLPLDPQASVDVRGAGLTDPLGQQSS